MPDRLKIDDDALFPIQTFFNAVSDESFLGVVDSLTSGVGYSTNECHCCFPSDLDPGDEVFQGVRFSLFEQDVVISNQELAYFIRLVCKGFVDKYPEKQGKVAILLERMR